jgi:hypothetical protein
MVLAYQTSGEFLRWNPHFHCLVLEQLQAAEPFPSYPEGDAFPVSERESSCTWARLIAPVYEVDPLVCPRCSAPMRILAVITEPEEVRKILHHLVKIGRSPPGLDPASLN